MAQLIVRNLDPRLVRALRTRAAHQGRSAEAEHRAILESVLGDTRARDFRQHLLNMPASPAFRARRSKDRGRKIAL